jgi:hypothetical protein
LQNRVAAGTFSVVKARVLAAGANHVGRYFGTTLNGPSVRFCSLRFPSNKSE